VVAARAKPPRRRPTGTRASGAPKNIPPAAAGGTTPQHLTPYELQREANIARNKARMGAQGVAGLA